MPLLLVRRREVIALALGSTALHRPSYLVPFPALPLTSSVTLGGSFDFSVPRLHPARRTLREWVSCICKGPEMVMARGKCLRKVSSHHHHHDYYVNHSLTALKRGTELKRKRFFCCCYFLFLFLFLYFKCCIFRAVSESEIFDSPLGQKELRFLHLTKGQSGPCSAYLVQRGNQHMEGMQTVLKEEKKKKR